jgi:putative oxidoreductase
VDQLPLEKSMPLSRTESLYRDLTLLVSRCMMAVLFLVAGYGKLTGFNAATRYFGGLGMPLPAAAAFAVAVEMSLGLALVSGTFTRPVALLLAAYTLLTALIGHHFWTMTGAAEAGNLIHFNKNLGIVGGLLLLYLLGAGRYSVDMMMDRSAAEARTA